MRKDKINFQNSINKLIPKVVLNGESDIRASIKLEVTCGDSTGIGSFPL